MISLKISSISSYRKKLIQMSVSEYSPETFTTVSRKRRYARKVRDDAALKLALESARIPGALWTNAPIHRSHKPGIPYSYYDDEIVMIRERTAVLIARQRAEAEAFARMRRRQQQQYLDERTESWHEVQWK